MTSRGTRFEDPAGGFVLLSAELGAAANTGRGGVPDRKQALTPPPSPALVLCAGSQFALKVLVRDAVTRQPLLGATVDIYVNHTLSGSAHTGAPAGDALLQVPYGPALSLTLLGRKDGYVPGPLPWSAAKRPRE